MVHLLEVGKLQSSMLCIELPSNSDGQRQIKVDTISFVNPNYKVHLLNLVPDVKIILLKNTFSHLSLLSVRAREGRVSEGRSLLVAGIEYGEGSKLVCGI
jgi:hypothetical protein